MKVIKKSFGIILITSLIGSAAYSAVTTYHQDQKNIKDAVLAIH